MAAVIATAAIPALLSGCAPERGPSAAEREAAISVAVEAVPTVTGSLVNISSAGAGASAISVKLYLSTVEPSSLSSTIDGALAAAWKAAYVGPDHITIAAVDGPKPANASMGSPDGVDLSGLLGSFGFTNSHASGGSLLVDFRDLATRYGPWVKPANG